MLQYFSIDELSHSSTAKRLGIDNTPPPEATAALERLIKNVLDPARAIYGRPIVVNSGYRSPELNKAVRGAANSQHVPGEAADITAGSPAENRRLFAIIRQLGDFDQLIDENNFTWIHVSYKPSGNRRQILKLGK